MDESPFPGAFMVRAVGEAAMVAGEANPGGVATLHAPAPNPSAGRATVSFSLVRAATVRRDVVNALGRTVATLADGEHAPGRYHADVPGALAPGVYVVRLVADGSASTRRLTVSR